MPGDPLRLGLVLLALYLIGGSANALNQYLERDIDAVMERTRTKRPLPRGVLSPFAALVFSIAIGVAGTAILAVFFNLLAAGLALGTILFYAFFYTLVLKPNTHLTHKPLLHLRAINLNGHLRQVRKANPVFSEKLRTECIT